MPGTCAQVTGGTGQIWSLRFTDNILTSLGPLFILPISQA